MFGPECGLFYTSKKFFWGENIILETMVIQIFVIKLSLCGQWDFVGQSQKTGPPTLILFQGVHFNIIITRQTTDRLCLGSGQHSVNMQTVYRLASVGQSVKRSHIIGCLDSGRHIFDLYLYRRKFILAPTHVCIPHFEWGRKE